MPDDPPAPPDVDVPDDDIEDDEDVVTVNLSPEGAYVLYKTLESVRAHRFYPYNYQSTPPDDVLDDMTDLGDLRRGLWKNRLVRRVHEERQA